MIKLAFYSLFLICFLWSCNRIGPSSGSQEFVQDSLDLLPEQDAFEVIYFLTDGMPSFGEPKLSDEICARIKELNQKRNVRINCTGLLVGTYRDAEGKTEDKSLMINFLKKLAAENDGEFRLIQGN